MGEGWLHVWCYLFRSAITSDMSADPVPLLHMPASIVQLYQTCMLGSYIQIRVFVDPGVASSILVRSHTFVEIDHEMISTVILLPSADLFKKGCCQLQAKVCARITC